MKYVYILIILSFLACYDPNHTQGLHANSRASIEAEISKQVGSLEIKLNRRIDSLENRILLKLDSMYFNQKAMKWYDSEIHKAMREIKMNMGENSWQWDF